MLVHEQKPANKYIHFLFLLVICAQSGTDSDAPKAVLR